MLSSWKIWRERNRRIFQHEELSVVALVRRIRDEATIRNLAGASFPFDPASPRLFFLFFGSFVKLSFLINEFSRSPANIQKKKIVSIERWT
jgi:hypothetical protein